MSEIPTHPAIPVYPLPLGSYRNLACRNLHVASNCTITTFIINSKEWYGNIEIIHIKINSHGKMRYLERLPNPTRPLWIWTVKMQHVC